MKTHLIEKAIVLIGFVSFVCSCGGTQNCYNFQHSLQPSHQTTNVAFEDGKNVIGDYDGFHNSSFSFVIKPEEPYNIILQIQSSYAGEQPVFSYRNNLYYSPQYLLSSNDAFTDQTWRIPKSLDNSDILITVSVPKRTTLRIYSIKFFYEKTRFFSRHNSVHFDSHLGFTQMCPENTISSVRMAGELGYDACIVVPKETKDGVLVCMHDDTINRTGSLSNSHKNEIRIDELTYDELLSYDFGSYKNTFWNGEKIMTVEEFFALCAEYGMRPIFSTHPNLSIQKWEQVKEMLLKYDLLKFFTIKSFNLGILLSAFSVFGDSIYGYTGDDFDVKTMDKFVSLTDVDVDTVELIIERRIATDASIIKDIVNKGYKAYLYTITSDYSEYFIRRFIELGVSGFTDDAFCQNGMGVF